MPWWMGTILIIIVGTAAVAGLIWLLSRIHDWKEQRDWRKG